MDSSKEVSKKRHQPAADAEGHRPREGKSGLGPPWAKGRLAPGEQEAA